MIFFPQIMRIEFAAALLLVATYVAEATVDLVNLEFYGESCATERVITPLSLAYDLYDAAFVCMYVYVTNNSFSYLQEPVCSLRSVSFGPEQLFHWRVRNVFDSGLLWRSQLFLQFQLLKPSGAIFCEPRHQPISQT